MEFTVNDATVKMLKALKNQNVNEALANLAIMWQELYGLGLRENEVPCAMNGIYILTKLVMRLNDIDERRHGYSDNTEEDG